MTSFPFNILTGPAANYGPTIQPVMAGPSRAFQQPAFDGMANPGRGGGDNPEPFDIVEWYPHFESCRRFFLDQAQHTGPVQALAAFVNITLPYQRQPYPVLSSTSAPPRPIGIGGMPLHARQAQNPLAAGENMGNPKAVSLIPYIRRLVITGFDYPGVLHGFFGDDWAKGIGHHHECERRNYLFAAKSTSWLEVKAAYDMSIDETVPFLKELQKPTEAEIAAAEQAWSDWLAMQDWMIGPRAPDVGPMSPDIKREPRD